MSELFSGSNADGSLAMDQNTCLDDGSKSEDSDSEDMNDMSGYTPAIDLFGNESNTLASPTTLKTTPNTTGSADNGSCSIPQSGMKHPRGKKSPTKKQPKPNSCFIDATEEIYTIMKEIAKALVTPPPSCTPNVATC